MSTNHGTTNYRELQQDLARKYRNVGTKLEGKWREFTPLQREVIIGQASSNRDPLKHSHDAKPDHRHILVPEFNLRDMTPEPGNFLDILKFRALTPLYNQLFEGVNQSPGDREHAENCNLTNPVVPSEEMTFFHDGEHYGQSYMPGTPGEKRLLGQISDDSKHIIVPSGTCGQMILARQHLFLSALDFCVTQITYIDLLLNPKDKKPVAKFVNQARATATPNLAIVPQDDKSSLPDVCAFAKESKAALADYLHLLRTEPNVLNHALNSVYLSRKESVFDSQGQTIPALLNRHMSTSFFDVVATAVKAMAIWDYILHLLEQVNGTNDKAKRHLAVPELSNTLHLEYRRTQEKFKGMVSPHNRRAGKCFVRTTDKSSGQFKAVMKGRPEDYTARDPQLHYILRLCDPETSVDNAVQWMQKLDDHNDRYADDRAKLSSGEMEALGDLAIAISFKHIASTAVSMTPVSSKAGVQFRARAAELEAELNNLKPKADFSEFVVPFMNILEPQMATKALAALEDFIVHETGAKLGSLYSDLVHDSLKDLEMIYLRAKTKAENTHKQRTYVPLPKEPSPLRDSMLADRRDKEKTRPTDSVYTITSPPETPQIDTTEAAQQFQVKASTVALFTALFSRSEARGSISWTDFESAMADLSFSVTPRGGSIFSFNRPASMDAKPITLHRPHISDIEGDKVFIFARKLQRAYEWTLDSFVVA